MIDPHFARTVPFAFHGVRLKFDLAHTLFSSAGIDPGSTLLLRHLMNAPIEHVETILDLGCGHGTLGIVLGALSPDRHVTFTDRDALALKYTERNAEVNGLARHNFVASLGYDDVDGPFDLIASNIPGKAGRGFIEHVVKARAAKAGTILGLVVVKPLEDVVAELIEISGHTVLDRQGNKRYEVFIARVNEPDNSDADGFDAGVYDRHSQRFSIDDTSWDATTVFGIDEFDSLSFATELLAYALPDSKGRSATLVNPGQGHAFVLATARGWRITSVVGRDLLALRATNRLIGVEQPKFLHRSDFGPTEPVLIVNALGASLSWLIWQVSAAFRSGTTDLMVVGKAGDLGRLEADLSLKVAARYGARGFRLLHLRR